MERIGRRSREAICIRAAVLGQYARGETVNDHRRGATREAGYAVEEIELLRLLKAA